jgi:hypothetical protein
MPNPVAPQVCNNKRKRSWPAKERAWNKCAVCLCTKKEWSTSCTPLSGECVHANPAHQPASGKKWWLAFARSLNPTLTLLVL